ncbi:ATP-binding protein [Candidatus Leptofilum sp.]|uniref:sensor histidine kinase n=1 Tax=Candidatus Leptofilum sp. TaxID=3241576 RepID=UPI003B59DEEE
MEYQNLRTRLIAARTKIALGIGPKIILPYFLLTLVVASVGAFVVTNLVASSLEERITNQLLDAGQIVAEGIIRHEEQRLQTLRTVIGTDGIPAAMANNEPSNLGDLAPQIVINSNTDAVVLLDMNGVEMYSWQRASATNDIDGITHSGTDFSDVEAVQKALRNEEDASGNRQVFITETDNGLMLYTVSPVFFEGAQIGVAMVGTFSRRMMLELTLNAVARVTLYDVEGNVLDTSLGGGEVGITALYQDNPEIFSNVIDALGESPEHYELVATTASRQVPLRRLSVLDQQYVLAYGDWQLRGQSFGMYSVALPSNFIVSTVAVSRQQFTAIFTLAIVAVFIGGFLIARRITNPIHHLVDTAVAVADGDFKRRSNIRANDEIGLLSRTFDHMTAALAEQNQTLDAQRSQLKAILDSIVDGIIVLDNQDNILTVNPAAEKLLADLAQDFFSGPVRELNASANGHTPGEQELANVTDLLAVRDNTQRPRRYQLGNRVLSALAAPVHDKNNQSIGNVIVMRDITREVEADNLKSAFITSISHELRTPLTVIKAYTNLMQVKLNGQADEHQKQFIHYINKGSEELEHHIEQLIRISELEAGTISMKMSQVNVQSLVDGAITRWQERFEEKNIGLETNVPEFALWVQADAEHLGRAIENLLSNALTYTPEGGHVELCVYEENGSMKLDVLDNGIGIAAADQPHLFNRFFRANNNVNFAARGVGLGLYITRTVIEMHGGGVSVNSELGVGSTFSIELPLMEPA